MLLLVAVNLHTGASFMTPASKILSKLHSQRVGTVQMKSDNLKVSSGDINGASIMSGRISSLYLSSMSIAIGMMPLACLAGDGSLAPVSIVRPILDTFVNVLSLLFVLRTVMSWYPKTDLNKMPYNIVAWPTEPLLRPVRELIPPAFGVDISAIVWIMLLSFFREILTGQQGILTLIERS